MKCSCGTCGPRRLKKYPCSTCVHYKPTPPDGIVGYCAERGETVGVREIVYCQEHKEKSNP